MGQYERTRIARAFDETKKFWNVHKTWAHFVPVLVGLVFGVLRVMSKTLIDTAVSGLLWALCFYVVAWMGSFLINYIWSSPAALHTDKQKELNILITAHETATRDLIDAHENTKRELAIERDKNGEMEITVEILEGFFVWGAFQSSDPNTEGARSELFITLCLRLVNVNQARRSVAECRLVIETQDGTVYDLKSEPVVVPSPHVIERDTGFYRAAGGGVERTAIQSIPDLDLSVPLERGVAVVGLVQFVISDLEKYTDGSFQNNATFTVVLTDSLRQKHEITRPRNAWEKNGRLIPASRRP